MSSFLQYKVPFCSFLKSLDIESDLTTMCAKFSPLEPMSDDFFTQIQDAEKKAEALVEGAQRKLQDEVASFDKKLASLRQVEIDKKRKQYQEKLAEKNIEGRELFEQRQVEGKKSVQSLKKDAEAKLGKMLPAVDAFFLNELLS